MLSRVVTYGIAGLISILASTAIHAGDEAEKLYPVDEASRDATLMEFRRELLRAVEARDAAHLESVLSPRVVSSFGGRLGGAEFVRRWQPQSPDSEVWPVLQKILSLGGGFIRSERGVKFCAPYVFTSFPDRHDIFGFGAITAREALLKGEPRGSADTVAVLAYDIVKVNDWRSVAGSDDSARSWVKVTTLDGREGYVPASVIRSPTDYHACFTKARREWKITSLVSGD